MPSDRMQKPVPNMTCGTGVWGDMCGEVPRASPSLTVQATDHGSNMYSTFPIRAAGSTPSALCFGNCGWNMRM